jgi:hypothetical protein
VNASLNALIDLGVDPIESKPSSDRDQKEAIVEVDGGVHVHVHVKDDVKVA